MLREGTEGEELRVQRLPILGWADCGAPHRTLDDLDVEADLLLKRADLALCGSPHALDRMPGHRVVNTSDEAGDAHDALQIHLDDIKRRRAAAMVLGELERQLVGERGLARVARTEQRDIGLCLERESDLVREGLHPDDLRGVVQRTVPDERVERRRHRRLLYRWTGTVLYSRTVQSSGPSRAFLPTAPGDSRWAAKFRPQI